MKNKRFIAGLLMVLMLLTFIVPTFAIGPGEAPTTNLHIVKVKSQSTPIQSQDHDGKELVDLEATFGMDHELVPNVVFKYVKLTDEELASILTDDMTLKPSVKSWDDLTVSGEIQSATTQGDGVADILALEAGNYLFIEDKPTGVIDSVSDVFLISLPLENLDYEPEGETPRYLSDVYVYPKNFFAEPDEIVKTIDRESITAGRDAIFTIKQPIPQGIESYTKFAIFDQYDANILGEPTFTVKAFASTNGYEETLLLNTDYTITDATPGAAEAPFTESFKVDTNFDITQAGKLIDLTPAGIEKLATVAVADGANAPYLEVGVRAPLKGVVPLDGSPKTKNNAALVWATPGNDKPDYPESSVEYDTGMFVAKKVNVKDQPLIDAVFKLTLESVALGAPDSSLTEAEQVQAFIQFNLDWAKKAGQSHSSLALADGTWINDTNKATVQTWDDLHVKSDAEGFIQVAGVESGAIATLEEVIAPMGYQLLHEGVDQVLEAGVRSYNEAKGAESTATITNIVNHKYFSPSTGDVGMGIFGGLGALFLLLAVYFYRKRSVLEH